MENEHLTNEHIVVVITSFGNLKLSVTSNQFNCRHIIASISKTCVCIVFHCHNKLGLVYIFVTSCTGSMYRKKVIQLQRVIVCDLLHV